MIDQARIAILLPHAGTMVLLDTVTHWDDTHLHATATSHQDPANPLRRNGHLHAVCAAEYALQAAALHGALRTNTPQPPGYVARLRSLTLHTTHLETQPPLVITATLDHAEPTGLLYTLTITTDANTPLLTTQATIALPGEPVIHAIEA